MTKRFATILAAPMAAIMLGATPTAAQDEEPLSDDVQIAYVYGDDEAPECPEGTICVIGRLPEGDRFRIPPALRYSDNPQNIAWSRRVESLELIGAFGTLSCSPAGAGGITGCTQQLINDAYKDREEGQDIRFSQLIEQARQERLSTIDEDAAAEQERVEQIEREYLERLERERSGTLPGEESPPTLVSPTEEEPVEAPAEEEPLR